MEKDYSNSSLENEYKWAVLAVIDTSEYRPYPEIRVEYLGKFLDKYHLFSSDGKDYTKYKQAIIDALKSKHAVDIKGTFNRTGINLFFRDGDSIPATPPAPTPNPTQTTTTSTTATTSTSKPRKAYKTASAYEKMRMWHDGERNENIKACRDEKLLMYREICDEKGYDDELDKIEDELRNRGLIESVVSKGKRKSAKSKSSVRLNEDMWARYADDPEIEYYNEESNWGANWGLSDEDEKLLDVFLDMTPTLQVFKKDGQFFIEDEYDDYPSGNTVKELIDVIKETFMEWKKGDPDWYEECVEPELRSKNISIGESLRGRRHVNEGRYSDVYDQDRKNKGWWYFTTHGVQPGSVPKDLNVLEVKDGKNDKGTLGTFVKFDGILNTDELNRYDLRELSPMDEAMDSDRDALVSDVDSLVKFLDNSGFTSYDVVDYANYPMGTEKLSFEIEGDWKHDHQRFKYLVDKWASENSKEIFKIDEQEIGNSDSDYYMAEYDIFISPDSETNRLLNSMRGMFGESLVREYDPAVRTKFIEAFSKLNGVDNKTAKKIYEQRMKRGDVDYINFIIESIF